jgi:hypothetical protein
LKNRILFAFFVCISTASSAQMDLRTGSHFMKDSTQRLLVNARGNYFFASDAITNEFAADYYLGKFLDDELKNSVSKNLSAQNIFAGEACWEASVTFHPDTNNRKVEAFIGFRSRTSADARFTDDFFELFFRGNKMFAGQTAYLGDFFFQQYTYRQFVFGIGNEFSLPGGGKLYVGADLAINNGIKFLKVTGQSSSLYTHPIGESIDADLHATVYTDDSSAQHPSKLDGTGYAGDFYLEYETEKSNLSFSVENFGSIQWNKWSTQLTLDSTFHFDGIDVRDLFEFGDSIQVSDAALDSVFYKNFVRNKTEQRITTQLPVKISGSYTQFFGKRKMSLTVGIDVLLNSYSTVRYYGAAGYSLSRSNHISVLFAAGGYTPLHGGLSYTHLFPWHLKLEAGSRYLYPWLASKTGKSQGAYLSLSKSF